MRPVGLHGNGRRFQLIPWFRLWEKQSASGGTQCFVGRLAGLRIVILRRRDNDPDASSDHDFMVFVAEPDNTHQSRPAPKPHGATQLPLNGIDPPQAPPPPLPPASPPRRPRGRGGGPKDNRIDDDPIPF